jgi:hypothetical protein
MIGPDVNGLPAKQAHNDLKRQSERLPRKLVVYQKIPGTASFF